MNDDFFEYLMATNNLPGYGDEDEEEIENFEEDLTEDDEDNDED